MHKLSVIIPTFNEEDDIAGALDSVRWADEIILVDSFSTDRTIEIAQSYNSQILQRAYSGPADQKNWAIPRAGHSWVLLLDADERVTMELQTEITSLLQEEEIAYDAFRIRRENYFMGRRIRYSGWQGDTVVRLIRRDRCRYNDRQVHEEIDTRGLRVGDLNHKLIHYTYKNLDHYLDKTRRYSRWSARDHLPRTPRVTLYHLFVKPLFRFVKHYFFRLGFLDGKEGFIISVIMAWGVFLRYLYIREMHNT